MSSQRSGNSEQSSGKEAGLSQTYSLPKNYDPSIEEPKWQQWWQDKGVYNFDSDDTTRLAYSIDTPPPYPSGEFHVGNALNWCYFDFVARYQRMKGYNVHFPQGWDCHGLPTEVRAEKTLKVRKNDIPASQFIELCRKLTDEYIAKMKQTIIRLGISTDWNLEYRTMDPSYYKLTQLSFVKLYKQGRIYRGEHPVNWCPRCETAIAEAEVVHLQRQGALQYMKFGGQNESIEIASTRPELLAACVAVAVHPEDPRYKQLLSHTITVPLFGQRVPIITDEEVDSSFGTGAVMVCTFGDKMDVKWQKKHGLPVIQAMSENGRITTEDARFKGLTVEEARKRIVEELKNEGRLPKTESSQQSIGTCWRCETTVEIISRPQWFMKTREMTEAVLEWAEKLRWVPSFAKQRLIDWARSLDWDWVISRQRIFATPIPVWYCKKCSEIIVPEEQKLPVDPREDPSPVEKCPRCGSKELIGEKDVLDTWMDSSITCAVHAGWPTHPDQFSRLFPADLQPNGLDIVRTWNYYLLVRSLALFQTAPYKTLLINGMVRGTDGRMMHKSYGNTVETEEALKKLGADAFRQWAATGGSTGYDIPFKWTEVEHGRKFLTKLWNIARFTLANLPAKIPSREPGNLALLDRWILGSTQKLISEVSEALDNFQFNLALEAIRNFTWHSLADDYLEAVKYRLQPDAILDSRETAQYCLYKVIITICKLIAPFCPHLSESIYLQLPKTEPAQSVHQSNWPIPERELLDERTIRDGETVVEAIATARRTKSEKGLALKSPIRKLLITAPKESLKVLQESQEAILRTLKAEAIELTALSSESPEGTSTLKVEIVA